MTRGRAVASMPRRCHRSRELATASSVSYWCCPHAALRRRTASGLHGRRYRSSAACPVAPTRPTLPLAGGVGTVSMPVIAITAARKREESRAWSRGARPAVSGCRRGHIRPVTAKPSRDADEERLGEQEQPPVVVNSGPSGTSTRAEMTPVTSTSASSHAAAVAYSLMMPWSAAGWASPRRWLPASHSTASRPQQGREDVAVGDKRQPAAGSTPSGCDLISFGDDDAGQQQARRPRAAKPQQDGRHREQDELDGGECAVPPDVRVARFGRASCAARPSPGKPR